MLSSDVQQGETCRLEVREALTSSLVST
jgi:hypothetical protein